MFCRTCSTTIMHYLMIRHITSQNVAHQLRVSNHVLLLVETAKVVSAFVSEPHARTIPLVFPVYLQIIRTLSKSYYPVIEILVSISPNHSQVLYMSLSLFGAVHVLGSLWFAAGDAPGGWVIGEGLKEMPLTRQYTRSVESGLRATIFVRFVGKYCQGHSSLVQSFC